MPLLERTPSAADAFKAATLSLEWKGGEVVRVEKKIEVNVPVSTAYNQWTQFEEFPRFMEGVKSVEQLRDERLHWVAEVKGKEKDWTARITRQVPDEVLAWTSEGGATNNGTVLF